MADTISIGLQAQAGLVRQLIDFLGVSKPTPDMTFASTHHAGLTIYGMLCVRSQMAVERGQMTGGQCVETLAMLALVFDQMDYNKTVAELVEMLWPDRTPNYRGTGFVHPVKGLDSPGRPEG